MQKVSLAPYRSALVSMSASVHGAHFVAYLVDSKDQALPERGGAHDPHLGRSEHIKRGANLAVSGSGAFEFPSISTFSSR